jgi:hypothetical protein
MRKPCHLLCYLLLCLIFTPGIASSFTVTIPGENGYYPDNDGVHSNYTGINSFIIDTPGVTFSDINSGMKSGWSSTLISPTQVNMDGPAEAVYFPWTYNFAGAIPTLLTIDYYVLTGGTVTGAFELYIKNGIWSPSDWKALPTPIPAAAWLLGSGIVGLVALRRRQK